MVAQWLERYMFAGRADAKNVAMKAAAHFNDASTHKSHGRRIDRAEARAQQLDIQDLEANQQLQETVLTFYHLATITFEKGPLSKILHSDMDQMYVKNWASPQVQLQSVQLPIQIPQRQAPRAPAPPRRP